jgi:hypothetical protein
VDCHTSHEYMENTSYDSRYCDNTMEKAPVGRRGILGSNIIVDK